MRIKIDPEFKSLIPPLTTEEFTQLEKSIVSEGCRDALVLWDGIIVDGHNRYEICQKHGIPFKTTEMQFSDREEAKDWIDKNQLGRRNLTPDQIRIIRGRRYERTKKIVGRPEKCDQNDHINPKRTSEKIGAEHGVSSPTIRRDGKFFNELESLKEKYPDRINDIYNGKKRANPVLKDIRRIEKKEEIKHVEPQKLEGKYNVIYADPPWQYDNNSTSIRGTADDHYPTLTIDEIKQIPVESITLDNAALFLWTTSSMIKKAFEVMEAWGFEFKTSMVWVKDRMGTGFFVRSKHEILLIGTKGSFLPMTTDLPESVIFASKEGHSKKPGVFYEIIEKMYPEQKYIELFARSKREPWSVWGNEV